mmetsp:Transcript_17192/g.22359  ORF Transcript_17192/g.22359 Transcript_17192/m.22359 type:complete len:144 (-) Transcript_17192:147-578(-)|eukprot:CAMPEP_0197290774 /NCGR_PEP_ID=MMETSP0890-20130614/10063_1 /TAXON_ID=44058 ORGANISM="Aureoumbra lagunensis, Strain CCMP1510" /NCGR_SAMPLE_ID=MMETSP0890 /ASSEMBLY_ACC=CAM_ASM_000533 /LENGTH=143 /DNA_ID=CAMNT_0042763057 /DNA_START=58 /DNA_END=489 /DNA_ORIENTATION=+
MKFLTTSILALSIPVDAFYSVRLQQIRTHQQPVCKAMSEDPVHSTENLLARVSELCDDEQCEIDALLEVKTDLFEHCSYIEKQLDTYSDENEEFDSMTSSSGDHSGDDFEHFALFKYLEKLRSLHTSINNKISAVEARLATAN